MVERPRTTGLSSPTAEHMQQWFGFGQPESPIPSFSLKPGSEHRVSQALFSLSRSKGLDTVNGRRALKDVLQCFARHQDIRFPPSTDTGGDTLYAQVAAAYDAYRKRELPPEAEGVVELFTQEVLLSLVATTAVTPTQPDIPEEIYHAELQRGVVTTRTALDAHTDELGQNALTALTRMTDLFAAHKAPHQEAPLHAQSAEARRPSVVSDAVLSRLPPKVASALTVMGLVATGCTTAVSPTISPTTEATRPALTAPLPTAEHTKTPTLTPTPTEAPTPTAVAKPDTSASYPGAVSDRVLTDTTLEEHKTAFATLVKSNSDVASEARTMETRLKLICGNTCTTEGVLDQARWGIIARNSDGTPLVLQKTTDGGKTWLNVSDASAYSELVANAKFDKAAYKLIPLQRPSGIPEDATGEVMTQNNWMVYVWRDKTTGKILAWYDAAHDQYLTVEGKKLELTKTYAYKPLSEMTTWEQCVAKEQQLPWIDDPAFENAWKALIAGDKSMPIEDNSLGLQVLTLDMPSNNNSIFRITGPYEWNTSSLIQGGYGLVDTCGQLITPDGKKLNFVRVAIKMVPNNLRAEFGSSYIHLTFIVDPELLKKNWPEKTQNGIYMPDYQPIDVQFPLLKTAGYNYFLPFSKEQPIGNKELTNKDTKNIATLIKQNQEKGIQEIWLRALQGKATKEELIFLQENAIIPVYYIIFSEN